MCFYICIYMCVNIMGMAPPPPSPYIHIYIYIHIDDLVRHHTVPASVNRGNTGATRGAEDMPSPLNVK